MQKVILTLAALIIAVVAALPAAAATYWNFGASVRYTAFWTTRDAGKQTLADLQGGGGMLRQDGLLDWQTQGNSRIKMHMRSDVLEGYIELGYSVKRNVVTARQYWGKYHIADKAYIAVGQQPQFFNQLISNQVWDGDLGMIGVGAAYKSSTPKIVLGYGNFALALSKPYSGRTTLLRDKLAAGAGGGVPNAMVHMDTDIYFPQLQLGYEYKGADWRVKLAGAYQHIRLNKISSAAPGFPLYTARGKSINAWLLSVESDISFGPLFLAAAASCGQNWSDAGWNDETSCMGEAWTGNHMRENLGVLPVYKTTAGSKNVFAWHDTASFMASAVAAYNFSTKLRFEVGLGYRHDYNKAFAKNSNIVNVYVQAAYTVAPGFIVTPEIGYINFGKNVWSAKDGGYLWYAGAQWRMDF